MKIQLIIKSILSGALALLAIVCLMMLITQSNSLDTYQASFVTVTMFVSIVIGCALLRRPL